MSFTIVGIISIAICLFVFILYMKKPTKQFEIMFALTVVATIFLDQGHALTIGSFIVEYNYVFTIFLFLSAIYLAIVAKRKLNKTFLIGLILFGTILITLVTSSLLQLTYQSCSFDVVWDTLFDKGQLLSVTVNIKDSLQTLIRFALFIFIIYVFTFSDRKECLEKTTKWIYKVSIIYAIYLLIEIFAINVLHTNALREAVCVIFGNGSTSINTPRSFIFMQSPMGIAKEPSNLALTFLYVGIALLFTYKNEKKGLILMLLYTIFAIIISSLGSILHIISCFYVFLFQKNSKFTIKKCIVIGVILIVGIVFINAYSYRLDSILANVESFEKGVSHLPETSEIIRLYSMYNNLSCLNGHFLFGTGIGSIYSFSPFVTLITNFGLVGTILYFVYYKQCLNRSLPEYKIGWFKLGIIILISFTFTGHLGYLIYFEKTLYLFATASMILYGRKVEQNACVCSKPVLSN